MPPIRVHYGVYIGPLLSKTNKATPTLTRKTKLSKFESSIIKVKFPLVVVDAPASEVHVAMLDAAF